MVCATFNDKRSQANPVFPVKECVTGSLSSDWQKVLSGPTGPITGKSRQSVQTVTGPNRKGKDIFGTDSVPLTSLD